MKLTVLGKEYRSTVVVEKDPRAGVTDADLAASTKMSLALYRDINKSARMINQIEWTRKQLEEFRKMAGAARSVPATLTALHELEQRIRALQDRLMQPTLAEADLKSFRGPLGIYLKLVWLQAESSAGGGDVSGNADHAPTKAELEVYDLLSTQLSAAAENFDDLYGKSIPAFNEAMRSKGLAQLMTVSEPDEPRPPAKPGPDEDDDDNADTDANADFS